MTLTGLSTGKTLPQEIADKVVDEIASSGESTSIPSLRACRLTSRIFQRSRKYLFSTIEFIINDNAYGRAVKLLEILEDVNNRDLLSCISSIKIVYDGEATAKDGRVFRLKKSILHRIGKQVQKFRLGKVSSRNHLLGLFKLFATLDVQQYKYSSTQFNNLHTLNTDLASSIFGSRFQHPPKSLSISGQIYDLSTFWFLTGSPNETLTELKLNGVKLPSDLDIFECTPGLVSLELLSEGVIDNSGTLHVFYMAYTPSPSKFLSRLETLSVSVLGTDEELPVLIRFIQSVSPTLQTLKLHLSPFMIEIYNIWKSDPHFLSGLTSLQTLEFQFGTHSCTDNFQRNLSSINQFLATVTSVAPIQSIIIDLTLAPLGMQGNINIAKFLGPLIVEWRELDRLLMNPMLAALQKVRINIRQYRGFEDTGHFEGRDIDLDIKYALFPTLQTSPSIQFDMVIQSNFTCTMYHLPLLIHLLAALL